MQSIVVDMRKEINIDEYFMGFYDAGSWIKPVLQEFKPRGKQEVV